MIWYKDKNMADPESPMKNRWYPQAHYGLNDDTYIISSCSLTD